MLLHLNLSHFSFCHTENPCRNLKSEILGTYKYLNVCVGGRGMLEEGNDHSLITRHSTQNTPWNWVHLEKPIVAWQLKLSPEFRGTRWFIVVPYLEPHESYHTLLHYFLKIHFNIRRLCFPGGLLPFGVSYQNFVCTSPPWQWHAFPDMITLITFDVDSNFEALHFIIFFSLLSVHRSGAQTLPSALCSQAPSVEIDAHTQLRENYNSVRFNR
jgi:hypothetical protein